MDVKDMTRKDPNIDGGWAWLVLISVYLGIIILSTTMFMGGVLYVALLDQFDASEAKTSLVGALNGGLLCLLGPFASIVMMTFSCRVCMFVGGACLVTSCVTSAFVESVDILILTYGIIGGVGNCLTSTPFVVVLGYYFQRRRNLVIAISQAVIGIGFFLASPLALIILNRFGLQGTFLILGGINAHLCVIAVVCKPSSVEKLIIDKPIQKFDKYNQDIDTPCSNETALNLLEKPTNEHKINVVRYESCAMKDDGTSMECSIPSHIVTNGGDNVCKSLLTHETDTINCSDKFQIYKSYDKKACGNLLSGHEEEANGCLNELQTSEEYEVNYSFSEKENHLKQYICERHVKRTKIFANRIWNFHLFNNRPFILFLFSTLSWNFTLSVCVMHLPNYMIVKGANGVAVSAIMTCFSASNLAGRFIAATTVEKGGIDSLTLHVGMLGVAGIVTTLFPFYSGSVGDYVFAAAAGLYTGGPNSIMTPITLKMVHIEDLPAAHGLEYFFSGLGYVPGPFIAGLLYTKVGTYEFSFICGGCILLLGCLLAMVSAAKSTDQTSTS